MVRRAYPVRTCVGCRKRAPASDLLRVVARPRTQSEAGEPTGVIDETVVDIVPDPTRIQPGRGAHLHFDPACLAQAVRRRAFGRALRVAALTQADAVDAYLNSRTDGGAPSLVRNSKVGRPT